MERYNKDVHIGKLIDRVIKQRGMTYAAFARLLYVDRTTVYGIVRSKSIDTDRLLRISQILNHDFLQYYYLPCTQAVTIELSVDELPECLQHNIAGITLQIKQHE